MMLGSLRGHSSGKTIERLVHSRSLLEWIRTRRFPQCDRMFGSVGEIPIGFPAYVMWGANTGVGKTLVSAGMAAAMERAGRDMMYVKPVQTGFPKDSDARLVAESHGKCEVLFGDHAAEISNQENQGYEMNTKKMVHSDGNKASTAITMYAWKEPVSPHVAMQKEGRNVNDHDIVMSTSQYLFGDLGNRAERSGTRGHNVFALIETAGGVCSPTPSGSLQCDILRELFLPAILVGDGKLGGISTTLSSYDTLLMRGYDIPFIIISEEGFGNLEAVRRHVNKDTSVISIPKLPLAPHNFDPDSNKQMVKTVIDPNLRIWLELSKNSFDAIIDQMVKWHELRLTRLYQAKDEGKKVLWWPFTQHGSLKDEQIEVIDSRSGENFNIFKGKSSRSNACNGIDNSDTSNKGPILQQQYDSCASWWTQGLTGDQQTKFLPRTIAAGAGRYGHVIFPEVVHLPALNVAKQIIDIAGSDWASRVFFSDDGSTAVEVALKMAFRKFIIDHSIPFESFANLEQNENSPTRTREAHTTELGVLGLNDAYHGDTLGAMDAVAPSIFNGAQQTPWFRGRGLFLEPPTVSLVDGRWVARIPDDFEHSDIAFQSLSEVFNWKKRVNSTIFKDYLKYIDNRINNFEKVNDCSSSRSRIGGCIIEPVVQGAGGMRMIDPLFQRAMITACRQKGIPVIFDEVFSGLWRLGAPTAGSLLGMNPDIACYAKLLTGGTIPMSLTVASEHVFKAFEGDTKAHALLHGHSYTAHPIGCSVAIHALEAISNPGINKNLQSCCDLRTNDVPCCNNTDVQDKLSSQSIDSKKCLVPLWDKNRVRALSLRSDVEGVMCIGTILAVSLKAGDAGYSSAAAAGVVQKLRNEYNVYARPLGNVVYLMVTPMTSKQQCDILIDKLEKAL